MTEVSLENGVQTIKRYLKTLPDQAGVYRMLNQRQQVLYVGKALSLKKRVASYTLPNKLPIRLQRMIAETAAMEFVVTASEVEALLLEANLIKQYDPPYNVRLKDDKFFAYMHISDHAWPRLSKYRGNKEEGGDFFGPFVSAGAIDQSLVTLYKAFKLRSCTDSYFKARKRPCLQYHIKRCSAPCVDYVSRDDYAQSVKQVKHFLQGKTQQVQKDLCTQMDQASSNQNYEKAALLRDQIKALTALQAQQTVNISHLKNADFFALADQAGHICIQGFFYRNGSNHGTHSFFMKETKDLSAPEILKTFLLQFYTDKSIPTHIFVNLDLSNDSLFTQALNAQAGQSISLQIPKRGEKKDVLESVLQNANDALSRQLSNQQSERNNLDLLEKILELPRPIQRIEVYDNSHIQGTNAIGAMIVTGPEGFEKKHYRKFTIRSQDLTPGDDFGMMREVLKRRFKGSLAQDLARNQMPDLVVIDGGKGQLSAALDVLEDLDLDTAVLSIAKGPQRNAGLETFYTRACPQGFKAEDHQALRHYLQRIRDEAHRFAITFHRAKRSKAMKKSVLDEIPGIGASRKRALLQHFGSAVAVKSASIEDIERVEGISKNLAKIIYKNIHSR